MVFSQLDTTSDYNYIMAMRVQTLMGDAIYKLRKFSRKQAKATDRNDIIELLDEAKRILPYVNFGSKEKPSKIILTGMNISGNKWNNPENIDKTIDSLITVIKELQKYRNKVATRTE